MSSHVSHDHVTMTSDCDLCDLMCGSCNIILISNPKSRNKKINKNKNKNE